MKNFLILLMLITFASCATKTTQTKPAPIEPQAPQITPVIVSDVFEYQSSLKWVKDLTRVVNCTVKKESFAKKVGQVTSFDYSNHNGEQVYNNLINHRCTIRTYRTKNPWSRVHATTFRNNKRDLYLNTRKHPKQNISIMVNTAVHECLHNAGYSHGDNSPINKQDAVPNKVGLIAQQESIGCN